MRWIILSAVLLVAGCASQQPPAGFVSLFNGRDLAGWKTDEATRVHWTAHDGVLRHDGVAKDLWSERELGDFQLRLEWRWPTGLKWEDFPVIGAEGFELQDSAGKPVTRHVLDGGDSGIFLRGIRKSQVNLFCYPCGSGEVWEYRTDPRMPAEVRRALVPKRQADRPVGEWNRMEITVRGERLTVVLNGAEVIANARLPDLPARGPIGFQHEHGPIEFRNISVKELPAK